eukprot:499803-Pleurochrysis_carterae.AAC.1
MPNADFHSVVDGPDQFVALTPPRPILGEDSNGQPLVPQHLHSSVAWCCEVHHTTSKVHHSTDAFVGRANHLYAPAKQRLSLAQYTRMRGKMAVYDALFMNGKSRRETRRSKSLTVHDEDEVNQPVDDEPGFGRVLRRVQEGN